MRISFTLLLFLFSLSGQLYSQTLNTGLVFRISAIECQELLESEVKNLDFLINRTAVNTLNSSVDYNQLPYGHYLSVHTQSEELTWSIHSHNQYQLHLHDDKKQLNVSVVNNEGAAIKEALLRFEKRKMQFQDHTQAYKSKRLRSGLLITYLPSDTIFYQIEGLENKSIVRRRLAYFSQSKIGYIVSSPVRWIKRSAHYLKRGFKHKRWRIYHWPFQRLFNRLSNKEIKGYIASNQPIYRIGDTLRLSAYVAKPNGRAIDRPLSLKITGNRTYVDSIISASIPGRYTMDWVLGDSLQLDAIYSVQLIDKKRDWSSLQYQFKIEDYQLDEYNFELLTKDATFKAHEPVELKLKVDDSNGLSVPATTVDGHVFLNSMSQLYVDSLLVPDTLWQFQEEMGNRTLLSLIPSDSIWPNALIRASFNINFQGPSGESKEEKTTFSVDRPVWIPILQLKGDSIHAFLSGTYPGTLQMGKMIAYANDKILESQDIDIGSTIKLNPYAEYYHWTIGDKEVFLQLYSEENLVRFDFSWLNDSLVLQWSNPRKLPIQWSLKTSNGIINDGESSAGFISIPLAKNQQKRQIWLYYSYVWNNERHQFQTDLKALNDQLQFSLETPEKIYPGQTENITISVKNAKGKPIKDVALTAAAYNAQFKQKTPYKLSDIKFKGRRPPFVRQRYDATLGQRSSSVPLHKGWFEKLDLRKHLYYRIRYPAKEGLFEYRPLLSKDSLAQQTAQISPWAVRNGRLEPIHLAYLDNRLVYYHDAWQQTPYSLVTEPGYHQVTLRTTNGEVRLDSVLLKAGQVLDLSFDLNKYNSKDFSFHATEDQFSAQEIQLLEKQLFYMRPMQKNTQPQFLYQNTKHIFQLYYSKNQTFAWGLFTPSENITWLKPGYDTIQFPFEPYFSYQINKKRDRLYAHRPLSKFRKTPLSNTLPHPILGREAIFLADIKAPVQKWHYNYSNFPSEAAQNRGRVQLFRHKDSFSSEALILSRDNEMLYLLHANQSLITLPAGQYTLSWVMKDSTLLEKEITIIANHLLALRIKKEDLTSRPISQKTAVFLKKHKNITRPRNGNLSNYNSQNNPYRDNGQLISGSIVDKNGEALIGVTIHVNGTKLGTITDIDGYYELWVPYDKTEISVNYLGFDSRLIDIKSAVYDYITLTQNDLLLDEIVIMAYKIPLIEQDNTSQSISIRGSREELPPYYIDGLPTRNVGALMGKVAGISVDGSVTSPISDEAISHSFDEITIPLDSIRDSFRDYAYWQPTLTTNAAGKVTFPVTFPDDITNWRHFAIGMDRRTRLGLAQNYTSAYLPLQAQLYTPRFLIEGDKASLSGVLTNRSGQSLEVSTFLQATNGPRKERRLRLELSTKEVFELEVVPMGIDSLEYTYGLQSSEYRDGEVRQIPIFPIGSKRTVGGFMVLNKDSTYQVTVDPVYGPVNMRIGGNGLPQLMREIEWLRDYRYGCNEQTASRLMALLAIERTRPTTLSRRTSAMINRLDKSRQANGSWGWWKSSNNPSPWITQHVLKALQKAEEMGYTIPDVTLAERYLIGLLPDIDRHRRLDALLFFAERGQVLDYEDYLEEYDTLSRPLNWELSYRRIQQLQDIPYQLDSISKSAHHTLTGARYWGTPNYWHYRPSRQMVGMTLLAYQLYRDAGMVDSLPAIQQYFMEDDPFHPKGAGKDHWAMNTYEASQMTETLLPDLLGEDKKLQALTVTLRQANEAPEEIVKFPKQLQILPTSQIPIEMDKRGDGPAFISYAQSYWDTNPPAESNGFTISTDFIDKGKVVSRFSTGQSVQLSVNVKLDADADYVLIEVPVPGGCSYGKKIFKENRWETHREYQRDRVAIFAEYLPKGNHHFTINLEPRFVGTYTVNPARVEMMYIPSFNGSTEMKVVEIE